MAIDNSTIIDVISITQDNEVALTISDHLSWDNNDHFFYLKNKINSYFNFIESNQIFEVYPDAIGKQFIINLALKYKPSKQAEIFLEEMRNFVISKNYKFIYSAIN